MLPDTIIDQYIREEGRIPILDYLWRTCSIPIYRRVDDIQYSPRYMMTLRHIHYETKSIYWKEVIDTFHGILYRRKV
jgi:hypothetical protein